MPAETSTETFGYLDGVGRERRHKVEINIYKLGRLRVAYALSGHTILVSGTVLEGGHEAAVWLKTVTVRKLLRQNWGISLFRLSTISAKTDSLTVIARFATRMLSTYGTRFRIMASQESCLAFSHHFPGLFVFPLSELDIDSSRPASGRYLDDQFGFYK